MLLSKARGPKTSAFIFSFFASFVISLASIELGTLSKTSSVADNIDIFGLSIPIRLEKSTAFFSICIFVLIFGKTFKAPSVIIRGEPVLSIVICQM